MLSHPLLCLLQATLVAAQARQQLSLNALSAFNPKTLPNPPAFTLPSSNVLAVSVAVCSGNSQSSLPRFFLTNDTSVGTPGPGGGANVFEIVLTAGLGNWTGVASNGGVLAVQNASQFSFEVGVSNSSASFLFLFRQFLRFCQVHITNISAHRHFWVTLLQMQRSFSLHHSPPPRKTHHLHIQTTPYPPQICHNPTPRPPQISPSSSPRHPHRWHLDLKPDVNWRPSSRLVIRSPKTCGFLIRTGGARNGC